jgi:hypothetical protein
MTHQTLMYCCLLTHMSMKCGKYFLFFILAYALN